MEVPLQLLHPEAKVPGCAYGPGDAGLDLYSVARMTLREGERAMVPTGIAVAIPNGYAGFVQPRSGLAADHGITLTNSPGLIDSNYRGEIMVIMQNTGHEDFEVEVGDRIAQLVMVPVEYIELVPMEKLPDTERGDKGFGSSGCK